jgi:hypothetical protein
MTDDPLDVIRRMHGCTEPASRSPAHENGAPRCARIALTKAVLVPARGENRLSHQSSVPFAVHRGRAGTWSTVTFTQKAPSACTDSLSR